VPRGGYGIGVDRPGIYRKILDTDAGRFGGSDYAPAEEHSAANQPWHGFAHSLRLDLPPLAAVFLRAPA
jgi:1,4-alpha-glucan branching enzyme